MSDEVAVVEEAPKPKPVKKKVAKKDNPDRIFLDKLKLYFSSLTARSAQYAYFNLDDNLVVLCNSTSGTPNDIHGDKIMEYAVGELTFHFVYFKDTQFFNDLRNFLKVPEGLVYCVQILNVISLLNKCEKRSDISIFTNEVGDQIGMLKGTTSYTKKNVFGYVVTSFHIVSLLMQWCRVVGEIGSSEHRNKHPHVDVALDPDIPLTGRVFTLPIDTLLFTHEDGSLVFKDVMPQMRILGLDGLTSVSLREFIRRVKKQPYTLQLYLWAVDDSYVLHMTTFENDMVSVKTFRPNILATPISNLVILDSKSMLPLTGETNDE